jgi:hypothetical protein
MKDNLSALIFGLLLNALLAQTALLAHFRS